MANEMVGYFKCMNCNEKLPTDKIGVYQICQCGNFGIDALSKNYCRIIGGVFGYEYSAEPSKDLLDYADKRGMINFITREENNAFLLDNEYYIDVRDGFSFFLYHYRTGFVGKFTKIKHAFKRYRKEVYNESGSKTDN